VEFGIFTQLSLVIVLAAVMAIIMTALRQPLIIGHILTGIIVGPAALNLIQEQAAFEAYSEIGIALLLFIIGLELSITVVKKLGKPVFLTAMATLTTIGTLGYLVTLSFDFTRTEAFITGLALFFSSTIIIAKVLSDKKELNRLNGQIAIGVILVEDVIATFALLFIVARSGEALTPIDIGLLFVKGFLVVAVLFFLGAKVLPKATRYVARSQELLFLFALAWGFGVAAAVNAAGFSTEVGALFAGVALAHLPYAHQIGARLKPLRDFFVILFFISLGEQLQLNNLMAGIVPALVLSFIVLAVKPLAAMASLGALGYTKRTSFKTGINLSQISEFSIILVVLATTSGLVGERLSAVITLVAIITIAASTYLMKYDNWIYVRLERNLHMFERDVTSEKATRPESYPLILFGYRKGGQKFLKTFQEMHQRYIVADYDPEVIDELKHKRIPYLYGDVTDPELLDELNIDKTKLIVNTIGDHTVNVSMIEYVMRRNDNVLIVCYSDDHNQAAELYAMGASFVMLPHIAGSDQLNDFIQTHGTNRNSFDAYREDHLVQLGGHHNGSRP